MSSPPTRALAVLGAMYVAQGIVWGFASFVLLPTLAARGVALEAQTGILALAGLPWIFKLAWGPVLDRFGGAQRGRAHRFASAGMLLVAASLFGLAGMVEGSPSIGAVAVLWLLLNVALSLQDVATDAMALDAVAPAQRGLANGVMLGGHRVGAEVVGGVALGMLVAAQGLGTALVVQGALVLALACAPWAMPTAHASAGAVVRVPLRRAFAVIVADRKVAVAALAAVVLFADVLTSALAAEFWIDRIGWSVEDVSMRLAPVVAVGNVVGFVFAATIADRLGHRRTAAIGSVALGLLWVAFAGLEPAWTHEGFLFGFVALQAVATALLFVGIHAILMNATVPSVRATHFALLTALLNLPRSVAPMLAPALLGALGWAGVFVAAGVMQAGLGWPILRVRPRATDD